MIEKKTIISYDSILMRISGMRVTQEYEILHKDSGAEISDYWMRCTSSGGMERELQRRAFCSDSQMLELLNQCDILKWNSTQTFCHSLIRNGRYICRSGSDAGLSETVRAAAGSGPDPEGDC